MLGQLPKKPPRVLPSKRTGEMWGEDKALLSWLSSVSFQTVASDDFHVPHCQKAGAGSCEPAPRPATEATGETMQIAKPRTARMSTADWVVIKFRAHSRDVGKFLKS